MASMATDAARTGFTGPTDPPSWTVTQVLGVQVAVSLNVFASALELKQRGGGQIVTLNAEMTMAAKADAALGSAIAHADLVIPDGAGVVCGLWAARATGCAAVPALSWLASSWCMPPLSAGGWPWWEQAQR